METKYKLTSKKFDGFILFTYVDGIIKETAFAAELAEAHLEYFRYNFPVREEYVSYLNSDTAKVEPLELDLSFANFWNTYGKKRNKYRTEPLWKKATKADRTAALIGIPKYRYYCKANNIQMVDPENYLRERRYEDDV